MYVDAVREDSHAPGRGTRVMMCRGWGGMSRDASQQSGAENEHVARVIANSRVARQNLRCEGADSIALCVVPVPVVT